jgi:hypothetical protein
LLGILSTPNTHINANRLEKMSRRGGDGGRGEDQGHPRHRDGVDDGSVYGGVLRGESAAGWG